MRLQPWLLATPVLPVAFGLQWRIPAASSQPVVLQSPLLADAPRPGYYEELHSSSSSSYPDRWTDNAGMEYVQNDGLVYELVSHPSFGGHHLRVTEPTLCDSSVQQYSGYLDISEGKHLFFWFFESRSNPSEDPLVLWLNGGPGCSSSTGLLFELGPCSIVDDGNSTTPNPYSWNNEANIVFLDQPVGVGFSYSTDGSSVTTSSEAAKDVYAFFELFMRRFPKYAKAPFHVAAESYGGRFLPHIASEIHKKNKELDVSPSSDLMKINLASVMIGNGLVDPRIQMPSVVEYACEGPYAIYDDPFGAECTALRTAAPLCQKLIEGCYNHESPLTCIPASEYCWNVLFVPVSSHGHNIYDARKKCSEEEEGQLCYREIQWIEKWMNDPEHKAALGVDPALKFDACNIPLNLKFRYLHGDGMQNGAALLPELINDGIRLLIYAGNADLMCNYMGESMFISNLDNVYHEAFLAAPAVPWSLDGEFVGEVRSAGASPSTAGNLTLAIIFEAGHMSPHDQPAATLDMMTRWIRNVPLA
ncbi:peptidase S10 serine carboxypeptidase [Leucogyrophana mollusca]|uniref:Peptidase S10 serine carboxypeptidase n=1 Tax=Leucogyrophana mollusca TaxID=85980 RepID=A0ACB8BH10_9AGAM|nr:peptidase S10 serine carboxypeptidase [Leucogyrophana mollusca]